MQPTKEFQQNMAALKQRDPALAKRVGAFQFTGRYKIEKTPTNAYTLRAPDDRYLYSRYNPLAEARRDLEAAESRNPGMLILLGQGLPYRFNAIAEALKGKLRSIMWVEPDIELFKIALYFSDMRRPLKNPGVFFVVGVSPDKIFSTIFPALDHGNNKFLFLSTEFWEHPVIGDPYGPYFKQFREEHQKAQEQIILNYGNDPGDGMLGLENLLDNVARILPWPGINQFYSKFQGRPAIIIATGPSLDKNIHLLPQAEGKAVLFSADASLKVLLKQGVRPDVVTAIERSPTTFRHLLGIRDVDDIWLCACPVVRREVYNSWMGPNIAMFRDFGHFRWLPFDKGLLNTGKSVTNMAFKIAEAWGCDPIILVGQDLAFARSGETHAAGADHARQGMATSALIKQRRVVMGNDGKPIETLATWDGMRLRYELDLTQHSGTCINATEGGAYIQGTKVATLAEALKCLEGVSGPTPKEMLAQAKPPTKKEIKRMHRDTLEQYDKTLKYLDVLELTCEKWRDKIREARPENGDWGKPQLIKLVPEIAKTKKGIVGDRMFFLYLMHVVQAYVIAQENHLNDLVGRRQDLGAEKTDTRFVEAHIDWFDKMHGMVGICRDAVVKGKETLEGA